MTPRRFPPGAAVAVSGSGRLVEVMEPHMEGDVFYRIIDESDEYLRICPARSMTPLTQHAEELLALAKERAA